MRLLSRISLWWNKWRIKVVQRDLEALSLIQCGCWDELRQRGKKVEMLQEGL